MSKGPTKNTEHVHCYPSLDQYERWLACAHREQRTLSSLIKVAMEKYCSWQESVLTKVKEERQ